MDAGSFDDEEEDVDIEEDVRRTFVVCKPYCRHARCMVTLDCMEAACSLCVLIGCHLSLKFFHL